MQLEFQLRTEIEFWRDAIDEHQRDISEESLERMVMARSLAERKLELLLENAGQMLN